MSDSKAPTATTIDLSALAASKVREVMDAQDLQPEERNLRLFVEGGGGCCGPRFGLAFDRAADGDVSFVAAGVTVVVDPVSLPYVNGATVDYLETPEVSGFKITVPQAAHAHGGGCGSGSCSPAEKEAAAQGGCGSGGCC